MFLDEADNRRMANRLDTAGVPNRLVEIPYAGHMFDINWGGWGSQVTRKEITRFLNAHLPEG